MTAVNFVGRAEGGGLEGCTWLSAIRRSPLLRKHNSRRRMHETELISHYLDG